MQALQGTQTTSSNSKTSDSVIQSQSLLPAPGPSHVNLMTTIHTSAQLPPNPKRFKFLSEDLKQRSNAATERSVVPPAIDNDIVNYIATIAEMHDIGNDCGLSYWLDPVTQFKFPALYEIAQDFVSAPASQAYSERVFSLCGDLSDRKRNSLHEFGKTRVSENE